LHQFLCVNDVIQIVKYFHWSQDQFYSKIRVRVILYIGTFHNILAISWRSVLLVEETRVPGENHNLPLTNFSPLCCIKDTLSCASFEFTTLVVIGTDCTGGCKSNYYTITTMTTPSYLRKWKQLKIQS
jgi:hypothetical protein